MEAPVGPGQDRLTSSEPPGRTEFDWGWTPRLAGVGAWSFDLGTGAVTWSDELHGLFDMAESDAVPTFDGLLQLIHVDERAAVEAAVQASAASGDPFSFDHRLVTDETRWLRANGEVELDANGRAVRLHAAVQDVTALVRAGVAFAGPVGPVTDLADRTSFFMSVRRALARAVRHDWTTALIAVDIDDFSGINETLGSERGDEVLVAFAGRFVEAVRGWDPVRTRTAVPAIEDNAAWFGGDRFFAVCENVDPAEASTLAVRLARALQRPMPLRGGIELAVTVGIGIGLAGPGGPDVEERVRETEDALVRAKRRGPAQFEVAADGVVLSRRGRTEAHQSLQRALAEEQLVVYYQPRVSLESDRITGVEALVRWRHPSRGLVHPDDFLPLAETSGLIVPIGRWVLHRACLQTAAWQRDLPRHPPLIVAVNVSGHQLSSLLAETVSDVLSDSGLEPAQLCLEMTETVLIDDTDEARGTLDRLAALGVKLSIDDFGTGYSSLAYLKRMPLHELKIDKCFVDGFGQDADDTAIVGATLALAHALGLSVVAEGVETVEQFDGLRALGCQEVQGYLVSKPMPAEAFTGLLCDEAVQGWRGQGTTPSPPLPAYRPQQILIVDDAAAARQLARLSLTTAGFEVSEASSGAQALEAAHLTRPDCVVLDIALPDMSGIEVCAALRADDTLAGCKIVMLTTTNEGGSKAEAFASGADDYVVKPASPRDLVMRVHAALRSNEDFARATRATGGSVESGLREERAEADRANEAKSEFLATMSHEIRTPLHGVIGMIGLLMETELVGAQRDYVDMARASAEALLSVINDVLDISKIEAGKVELEEIDFDLRTTVETALDLVAASAHDKGLEVIGLIDPEVPVGVRGDPGAVRQVMTNLLSNAVKFTASGEILVTVDLVDPPQDSIDLRIGVSDNGVGIDAEDRVLLFDRFSQADKSTTRQFGGTGLGLAISKKLVGLLDGEIGVESQLGQGSSFWFTARLRPAAAPVVRPLPTATGLAGLRVLVVRQSATGSRSLEQGLRSWMIDATCVPDNSSAMQAMLEASAANSPFDLAIVDSFGPVPSALALARQVRSDARLNDVRLVLLEPSGRRGDPAEASAAGFLALLTKPVHEKSMIECLTTVMNLDADASSAAMQPAAASGPTAPQEAFARVLVVEDHEANRQMTALTLRSMGYLVDVAASGREALEAMDRNRYAAVLMDCQMPGMDGYDATAEIRRREGTRRHTPVIAMTADATLANKARCLEAGMDEYLAKPTLPTNLHIVLTRWTRRLADAAPGNPPANMVLEPVVLGALKDLERQDAAGVAEIVNSFLQHTATSLDFLRQNRTDVEVLARAAHSLRGSCASFAAIRMASLCRLLEDVNALTDGELVADTLAKLDEEYDRVARALRLAFRLPSGLTPKPDRR